jgi:hypothetical protein
MIRLPRRAGHEEAAAWVRVMQLIGFSAWAALKIVHERDAVVVSSLSEKDEIAVKLEWP